MIKNIYQKSVANILLNLQTISINIMQEEGTLTVTVISWLTLKAL